MKKQYKKHKVLGIMSGTSFDGIDFCLANFIALNDKWSYEILFCETVEYDPKLKKRILAIEKASGADLIQLHFEYGRYLGGLSLDLLNKYNQTADLIASHGHTIFHQTEKGFTFQLGHGASIAATSAIKTVCDFRSLDVALGGEGAPLVPFGDIHLFPEYNCCINLGGIANLSFQNQGNSIAFDIAPANMVLNYLYQQEYEGEYDFKGLISRNGSLNEKLFSALNSIDYYHQAPPKSIGKEWVYEHVIPIINSFNIPPENKLYTYSKHLVAQIAECVEKHHISGPILISGGGAKNDFLIELLKEINLNVEVAKEQITDFKEALIFAFLGLNRLIEKDNTLKSVSGALRNSCGGAVYMP